jgi:type II secretory pathway component PulF
MKNYKYVARDSTGERKEGLTRAATANDVLTWLRENSLLPIAIGEIFSPIAEGRYAHHRKRIRSADLAAFCWQLTTMLEGGIPITVSIDTIAEDIENTRL